MAKTEINSKSLQRQFVIPHITLEDVGELAQALEYVYQMRCIDIGGGNDDKASNLRVFFCVHNLLMEKIQEIKDAVTLVRESEIKEAA